jgi:hypothetical protein
MDPDQQPAAVINCAFAMRDTVKIKQLDATGEVRGVYCDLDGIVTYWVRWCSHDKRELRTEYFRSEDLERVDPA